MSGEEDISRGCLAKEILKICVVFVSKEKKKEEEEEEREERKKGGERSFSAFLILCRVQISN